jgi:hypothetical protein
MNHSLSYDTIFWYVGPGPAARSTQESRIFRKNPGNLRFFRFFREFSEFRKSAQMRLEFFCGVRLAKNPKMTHFFKKTPSRRQKREFGFFDLIINGFFRPAQPGASRVKRVCGPIGTVRHACALTSPCSIAVPAAGSFMPLRVHVSAVCEVLGR